MMSICKYFKCVATGTELDEHEDEGLLEPTGLALSKSVSTKATKLANAKVTNVTPCNSRARPYFMLTSAQRSRN